MDYSENICTVNKKLKKQKLFYYSAIGNSVFGVIAEKQIIWQ